MANRPTGREKHVSGGGSGVNRRGTGASGGPVGGGYGPRPGGGSSGGGYHGGGGRGSGGSRAIGGGLGAGGIIIVIILMLVLSQCSHGSGLSGLMTEEDHTGYLTTGTTSSSWEGGLDNNATLNGTVADVAREKRTQILGSGQDVNTILVYMCGTDLESRSGMATRDLQEMLNADVGENVNLIIYTGGCAKWQNNVVSSKQNQIYQIQNGKLRLLKENAGNGAMTEPDTLSSFIRWGAKQYPANRYDLILWDHGGGSVSGYGYDEKYPRGSMTLAGINTALKDSGVTFDFIGFDACLMATVETGLVAAKYADYMIASEETEPGVGWYYTDWLSRLSANPSMTTLELGKTIIDSYINTCAKSTPGQATTLSLTDLAELEMTAPPAVASFAKSTSNMINTNGYQTVAAARADTREFAASNKIDQVDFVHLARKIGTDPAAALAKTLLSAVKYNRTSANMTNAYGLSVYFPYKQMRKVDSMVSTYQKIGMDEDYTRCIQEFASMEVSGQVVSQNSGGGATSLLEQLAGLSNATGSSSGSGSTVMDQSDISSLLGSFMSGGSNGISLDGMTGSDFGFLGRTLDVDAASSYIAKNQLDQSNLVWADKSESQVISLPEEQWELVQNLDLNMFYDDGNGYVDLGLDNVFDFDNDGDLELPSDRTWLAINGQSVAYYRIGMTGTEEDYTITGRVPAELNGSRVNLILVFDSANPQGYIAGASYDYVDGETETLAKNLTELNQGDELDFICDVYDYDGSYIGPDYLGSTMTVNGSMEDMKITNTSVGDGDVIVSYRFQDIYGQEYWTPAVTVQ